jgi:hypothetical protein
VDDKTGETVDDGASLVPTLLLGPFAGVAAPLVKRLSKTVRHESQRRHSVALAAAERVSGMSREDIAVAIADNPDLVPLLTRLLYTSGMTRDDRTLRLLGAALADAVVHPARIHDADMISRVLTDFTPAHFVVLRTMSEPNTFRRNPDDIADEWQESVVIHESGLPPGVGRMALSGAIAAGLVIEVGKVMGHTVVLSDFGRTALELIDELDHDSAE